MKIALTGTAGTGKSTLARSLAEKYELTLIDESFDELIGTREDARQSIKVLQAIFDKKAALENALGSFVSDRCPIDLLHICLRRRLYKQDRDFCEQFITSCCHAIANYDFVIVPPWLSFPLQQSEPGLMARNMDELDQLSIQAMFVGYSHMWVAAERIIEIPRAMHDLAKRVEFVDQYIARHQASMADSSGCS